MIRKDIGKTKIIDMHDLAPLCEGQVWECANGDTCGVLEVKDGFAYCSYRDGTIRMHTDSGKHSKEYDLVKCIRSYPLGVKVTESPALKMQMMGRAKRERPEPCKKMQALRAVYGYFHCDPFTSEDLNACKEIIKEALNDG